MYKQTMYKQKQAFTLVELIVVITILAILGTIAIMAFSGYSKNARDSARITDLSNIKKGLALWQIKAETYPMPEDSIQITASGTIIGYQGYVKDQIGGMIGINKAPVDPLDTTNYLYSTDVNRKKMQLLTFLEGQSYVSYMTQIYAASDLSLRIPRTFGDELGIVLNSDNSIPTANIETNTGTTEYKLVFDTNETVTATGNTVFSNIYNRREDLIKDTSFAPLDESLVGYWDMESTVLSGSTLMLKDLSKYGNHGICYNSGILVNCATIGSGPQTVAGSGKTGKAMSFDGVDDYIKIINLTEDLQFKKENTTIIKGKVSTLSGSQNFIAKHHPLYMFVANSKLQGGVYIDNWEWLISNYTITINEYYNFVNRWNSNSKVLDQFINNNYISKLYNYLPQNLITTGTGNLFIGADDFFYNRNFLNGAIDEVRIYNRALSDNEIEKLYNSMNY